MDLNPVFVDGSGRRRMTLRWSGIAIAGILASYLVLVGIALLSKVTVPRAALPDTVNTHAPGHHPGHHVSRVHSRTPTRRSAPQ